MPARAPFEYTVLRVVPDIEREEFLNAGVVVFCKAHRFLDARVSLDEARLLALDPQADPNYIRQHLELILVLVRGGPEGGDIGRLPQAERFRWLASPRNTIVQPSPVHPGLCHDPQAVLDALFTRLVLRSEEGPDVP